MEDKEVPVCEFCKRVAIHSNPFSKKPLTDKDINHKRFCTEDFRAAKRATLRSDTMPELPRTPVTSGHAAAATPAAATPTVTSASVPSTPSTTRAAATPKSSVAGAGTSEPTPEMKSYIKDLETQLKKAQSASERRERERDEAHLRIQALSSTIEERSDQLAAEQVKSELLEQQRSELEGDLLTVAAERDTLKGATGTPGRHPPLPNSMQAMLEASDRHHEQTLAAFKDVMAQVLPSQPAVTPAAVPTGPKTNPAARHLEIPILPSPSSVLLHHFYNWKDKFVLWAEANGIPDEPFQRRCAFLSHALHGEWQPLIKAADVKWEDTYSLEDMIAAIGTYIKTKRHALLDRVQFLTRRQRDAESTDSFLLQLKELFQCTRYNEEITYPLTETAHRNLMLRDLFLTGINSPELRKRILEHKLEELSLDKTIELARALESAQITGDSLTTKRSQALRRSQYKQNQKLHKQNQRTAGNPDLPAAGAAARQPPARARNNRNPRSRQSSAPRPTPQGPVLHLACNTKHAWGRPCAATNHTCAVCKGFGHVESSPNCPKSPRGRPPGPAGKTTRALRLVATDLSSKDCIAVKVAADSPVGTHRATWNWLPDSGSDVAAAGLAQVTSLIGTEDLYLETLPHNVNAVDGHPVDAIGTVPLSLSYKDRKITVKCYVFAQCDFPVLGKVHCVQLGLLPEGWPHTVARLSTRQAHSGQSTVSAPQNPLSHWNPEELFSKYPKVFATDGKLGKIKGKPISIELVDGAIPFKLYKPYQVPLHYEPLMRKKFDYMLEEGVVERVPPDEVPEWTAGVVVADKKDSDDIRVTVDLSKLNKFVRRPPFAVTVPAEKVRAVPSGMKYFSSFDAKHGFWQCGLHKDSRDLTCFITTTHGLMRYRVLPMGISIASAYFGQRVELALRGLTNATSVVEDILCFSATLEEHKKHVHQVLQRCHDFGIQLHREKMSLAVTSIDYCGFRLDHNGYTVSPRLSNALSEFPRPSCKTDVRSLCGLINQFRDYDDSIAELTAPLTCLMSPKVEFMWTSAQEQAFTRLKTCLMSPRILAHFIPGQPLRLETDASRKGLGFCLLQQGLDSVYRYIQLGSRATNPAESRYSVTELELLAVAWSLDKARFFCAGAPVIDLVVDHRPLIPIVNDKSLGDLTTPRIQRLRERLNRYNSLTAVWRAGKAQVVADFLSRNPVDMVEPADLLAEHDITESVRAVCIRNIRVVSVDADYSADSGDDIDITRTVASDDLLMEQLKRAARSDSTYRKLHELVSSTFPEHKSQLDDDIKPYWTCRDDLSTYGPLVLYKHRTVIPDELRKTMLDRLHAAHAGESKTLLRAQQSVFWPRISHHIKDTVKQCLQCQRFRVANPPEPPLHNSDFEIPTASGQYISLDFFHHNQTEWLVISDNYSGYFQVYKMGRSATSADLIHSIRDWSSHLGWPLRIRSDGGPQMDSAQYKTFCDEHYIRPSFSSPLTHCSTAEVAVKTAKNILRKTSYSSPEFFAALLEYRSSPRSPSNLSPNSLVYKSAPRTLIPVIPSDTQVPDVPPQTVNDRRRQKETIADSYARHKDNLSRLFVGQRVRVLNNNTNTWDLLGTIQKAIPNRRSYMVKMDNGGQLWRNRKLLQAIPPLLQAPSAPTQDSSDSSDDSEPGSPAVNQPPVRRSSRTRRPPNRFY